MLRRDDLLFPMEEYERRLDALRHRMGAHGVEALLVTDPEGMHYLTTYQTIGYYYFQALVVPLESEPFMVVRLLEESNVVTRTWIEHCRPYLDTEDPIAKLVHSLEEFGLDKRRIGYDRKGYFFRAHEQEKLFSLCPNAKFVECSGLVEEGRLIKSDHEIALMRKAARAAEAGMEAGINAVTVGASENDVAADIHYAMYKAGGEYPALSPFVASGPRCLIGHATWEGRAIEPKDCVMLEIGGCIQRYHCAMMRTVYLGEPPKPLKEAEAVVLEAVQATMDTIRPGITAKTADAVNRSIIASNTIGAGQATRSGYSIGISFPPDWGEGHILSLQPDETRLLETNMTFHLIPWIQIPGLGVMALSETIRVTETGCESLLGFERKLFVRE
ncbi:peptidase M24 [filamentous cyanobacterium CCP5]|nr:peptidase M24 [filamentous cyanobacterium CCP5]